MLCSSLATGIRRLLPAGCLLLSGCGDGDGATDGVEHRCSDPATLCTYAGNGEAAFDGDGQPLLQSSFYWPIDVTITTAGDVYVLDWNNHAVRKVESNDTLTTVIGSGFVGDGPPDLSDLKAPGAPGDTVDLNHPTQLVELPNDNLLLVAWHNHKLREYDPKTGLVLVTCGSAPGFSGDGEPAQAAKLNQPTQVILGPAGDQFVLDMRNQVVRKIDVDGVISTVAGTPGKSGYAGDGGSPLEARFDFPAGSNPPPGGALAFDREGRLYVSDTLNHVIRRIDFEADTIETIAGTGEAGFSGDGGDATEARLSNPRDLQLGLDGKLLYVADEMNHRVRAINLAENTIETLAGDGNQGYDGEGLAPDQTALNRPAGLALDAEGLLYIADTYNHRIRRFEPGAAQ